MAVKTSEQLFAALNAGTKWDAGVAFHRTNGLPLDEKSIFASLSALETYVANDPVAYAGQVVAVVESGESTAYIINDDGTVSEIGNSLDIFNVDSQGRLRINTDVILTTNNSSSHPTPNKTIKVKDPEDETDVTNKRYVDSMVSSIPKFGILVVDSLPAHPSTAVLYLLKSSNGSSNNLYDEYIFIGNTAYDVNYLEVVDAEHISTRQTMQYVVLGTYHSTVPEFVANTYYKYVGAGGVYDYALLQQEPDDWATAALTKYYEKTLYGTVYSFDDTHLGGSDASDYKVRGYDGNDTMIYNGTLRMLDPSEMYTPPCEDVKSLNRAEYFVITYEAEDPWEEPPENAYIPIQFIGTGWEKLGSQQIDISGKMDKFGTYTTTTSGGTTTGTITPTADELVIENLKVQVTPTNPSDPASKNYVDTKLSTVLHINESNTAAEIQTIINTYLSLTQEKRDKAVVYYTYTHATTHRTVTIPLSRISVPDTSDVSAGQQYRWYFYDLNHDDTGSLVLGSLYAFVITALYHPETVQSDAYVDTPSTQWSSLGRNTISNSTASYDSYIPSIGAVKNYVSSQSIEWQSL